MTDSEAHQKPTHKSRKHLWRKRRWIIGVIVVVLLLAVVASAWLFLVVQKPTTAPTKNIVSPATTSAQATTQALSQAQQLAANGKLSDAKTVYDNAVKQSTDASQKSFLLLSKATLSFNAGNYDDALVVANQAAAVQQTSTIDAFIAQIYEKKGDAANAIKYYQAAIPLVDKTGPTANQDIQYYQTRITALGGAKG